MPNSVTACMALQAFDRIITDSSIANQQYNEIVKQSVDEVEVRLGIWNQVCTEGLAQKGEIESCSQGLWTVLWMSSNVEDPDSVDDEQISQMNEHEMVTQDTPDARYTKTVGLLMKMMSTLTAVTATENTTKTHAPALGKWIRGSTWRIQGRSIKLTGNYVNLVMA